MIGRILATAVLCVTLTGCTSAVAGAPTAATDTRVGRNVVDMLPTPAEITDLTGVEMEESDFPPTVGTRRVLPDGIRFDNDATEIRCLGVTMPAMARPYEELPVWAVARDDIDTSISRRGPSVHVKVNVIALTTDAAAAAALTSFTEQWKACEGKTVVVKPTSGHVFSHHVNEVETRGELLTASVEFTSGDTTTTDQRALGVRANCVVDVEVSYFDAYEDTTAPDDLAERVVDLVLGRIADAT